MYQIFDPKEAVATHNSADHDQDDLQVVFRIPTIGDGEYYTIMAPKYVLDTQGQQHNDADQFDEAVEGELHDKVAGQVYISYDPEDAEAKMIGDHAAVIFQKYGVPVRMLPPEAGVLTFEHFDAAVRESDYFLAVFTAGYMAALGANKGRVFQEMMAAAESVHPSKLITMRPAAYPYPSLTWRQDLEPAILGRAFSPKCISFQRHRGHRAVLEQQLLKGMPHITPDSHVTQHPLYDELEALGLGSLARTLLLDHGVTRLRDLHPEEGGDPDLLPSLGLEEAQCAAVLQRAADARKEEAPPGIEPHKRNAKALVEVLWSSGRRQPLIRQAAAQEIRQLSTTEDGRSEIRTFAGFESLFKMVTKGSAREQAAAMWALTNFAVSETFRQRIAESEVLTELPGLLASPHVDVLHSSSKLCQMLSVGPPPIIAALGHMKLLRGLAAGLSHRSTAIRAAAAGALGNLAVNPTVRQRIGRCRTIPRLVDLLSSDEEATVALAASALHNLVQDDACRLRAWREGGVDRLKALAATPSVGLSDIAGDTLQVLMAGPRIQPSERFRTKGGRSITAKDMRATIRRLNKNEVMDPAALRLMTDTAASLMAELEALTGPKASPRSATATPSSRQRPGTGEARRPGGAPVSPARATAPAGAEGVSAWGGTFDDLPPEPLHVDDPDYGSDAFESDEEGQGAVPARPHTVAPPGAAPSKARGLVSVYEPAARMGTRQSNRPAQKRSEGEANGGGEALSRAGGGGAEVQNCRVVPCSVTSCFSKVLSRGEEDGVVNRLHNSQLPWRTEGGSRPGSPGADRKHITTMPHSGKSAMLNPRVSAEFSAQYGHLSAGLRS